ncbi:nuclear transport factor 2 family protein [Smaragdicoccus niigatensis]|uniref:nuclear transport factor 2 family protein n=1 Tax=Smaragdicoccus niigatensis TaxID=359359 RepID=UPI000368BB99|nr:nuclear transport factor 2 family protein [Smaragdicoccus niigatensis]
MDLDAIAAISRLKYRHVRALDTKQWDLFADTLTPTAEATYGEYLQFESRDAFVQFMQETLGPHVLTEHRCGHPEIDVKGRTATGVWMLSDLVLIPEHDKLLRGSSVYTDEYQLCEDGAWRISSTTYKRTFELSYSLKDLPSFKLTAPGWMPPPADADEG